MKLTVSSTVGQTTSLTVRDDVFGAPQNPTLIAQAVRVYLSNQRQGTSKVKTRGEINRTKKKWFKQKGTGNARHGARTPSLFVGGGVAHGPTGLQNWNLKMSSMMKKRALASALSTQVEHIVVSDDIMQLDGKTASAHKMLGKMLPGAHHVLVVLPKSMPMVLRSLRNLPYVYVTGASRLTTFEVANADAIILTKESVKMLEDRLAKDDAEVTKSEVKAEKITSKAEKVEKEVPKKEATAKTAKPAVKKVVKKKAETEKKVKSVKK